MPGRARPPWGWAPRRARRGVAGLHDVRSRSGTFDDATHVEGGFLQRHGLRSTGLFGLNRSLRYSDAELGLLLTDDAATVG